MLIVNVFEKRGSKCFFKETYIGGNAYIKHEYKDIIIYFLGKEITIHYEEINPGQGAYTYNVYVKAEKEK